MPREYTDREREAIAKHPDLNPEVAAAFADELLDPELQGFWQAMESEPPASWPKNVPWPPSRGEQ